MDSPNERWTCATLFTQINRKRHHRGAPIKRMKSARVFAALTHSSVDTPN